MILSKTKKDASLELYPKRFFFRRLATEELAHLWSESNIESVVSFARNSKSNEIISGSLSVLCDVVKCSSTEKLGLSNSDSSFIKLCESACYGNDLAVVARGTNLITLLAIQCKRDMHHVEGIDVAAQAVMSIEALFLLMNSGTKINMKILKVSGLLAILHRNAIFVRFRFRIVSNAL